MTKGKNKNEMVTEAAESTDNAPKAAESASAQGTGGGHNPAADELIAQALAGPLSDLEKQLVDFPVDSIKSGEHMKDISDENVRDIVENIRTGYGISSKTSLNAICELIRRGGAAKSTPPSFSVEIYCPEERTLATILKRDVARAVELICKGKRNLRNLAQKLAPIIVRSGLRRQMLDPKSDMSGDLARKINRRLVVRKEKPLTPYEKVGCASYAQTITDLDNLCGSDRLLYLLTENLDFRSKSNKGNTSQNNQNKKNNKNTPKKGKKQQKRTGR